MFLSLMLMILSAVCFAQNQRHNGVNPNSRFTIHVVSSPSGYYATMWVKNDSVLFGKAIKVRLNGIDIAATVTDSTIDFDLGNVATFESGTYTPTLTNTTNVSASTAYLTHYYRVGDMGHIFGKVSIDPTTTGAVILQMSTPPAITTGMTGADLDAGGTAVSPSVSGESIALVSDAGADVLRFKYVATDVSNHTIYFHVTFKITPNSPVPVP